MSYPTQPTQPLDSAVMCGRFVATTPVAELASLLGAVIAPDDPLPGPRYNIAPSAQITVMDRRPHSTLRQARWGLIPTWARDAAIGTRLSNARAETLWEKPSFRDAAARHRCVIAMDGFYEWAPPRPDGPRSNAGRPLKRPHLFTRRDGAVLSVAGVCSLWRDPADPAHEILTTTIVTCDANAVMAPVHHRMPVIVERDDIDEWLDEGTPLLLRPAADDVLTVAEVGTRVNDARNEGSDLLTASEPPPQLF